VIRRTVMVVLCALGLSGCAAYTLVEPKAVTIADVFVVESPIQWSGISNGHWELWTVDGPGLQSLQFLKGLADNEPMFSRGDEKRPRFRKDMPPNDVMELVADSLVSAGAQQMATSGLRPATFVGADGFRFELEFATKEGLPKRGFVVGSIVREKLYLIMYLGAADHYYGKHLADAERVVQSARAK